MLDVLIIGGGVTGCSIARELSRYKLDVALVEAKCDVGKGTSSANSGIVHAGYDPKPGTMKARFNVLGNLMFDQLAEDLQFAFTRCGSYVVGFDDNDMKTIDKLLIQATLNEVDGCYKVSREELLEREPNLTRSREYTTLRGVRVLRDGHRAGQLAMQNGVKVTSNEVTAGCPTTVDHHHTGRVPREARGQLRRTLCRHNQRNGRGRGYQKQKRRGDYFIYDKKHAGYRTPSFQGHRQRRARDPHAQAWASSTCGPEGQQLPFVVDFVWNNATRCCPDAAHRRDRLLWGCAREGRGSLRFLHQGIRQAQGLLNLKLTAQAHILPGDRQVRRRGYWETNCTLIYGGPRTSTRSVKASGISPMSKSRPGSHREGPRCRRIVCRCETVTEGEVVDAIHRTPGTVTLGSVKYRTRADAGCQGGFCDAQVMDLISRDRDVQGRSRPAAKARTSSWAG